MDATIGFFIAASASSLEGGNGSYDGGNDVSIVSYEDGGSLKPNGGDGQGGARPIGEPID